MKEAPRSDGAVSRKYVIGKLGDFPPGSRMRVEVNRFRIAVFNLRGHFHAISDKCPHQFASLSRGRLQGTVVCGAQTDWQLRWEREGEVVVCPGHGMEFDVKTGEAFGYKLQLPTYEVVVEDEEVKLIL